MKREISFEIHGLSPRAPFENSISSALCIDVSRNFPNFPLISAATWTFVVFRYKLIHRGENCSGTFERDTVVSNNFSTNVEFRKFRNFQSIEDEFKIFQIKAN